MKRRTRKIRRPPTPRREKKPYTAPQLTPYGTLRDLVRLKGGSASDPSSGTVTKKIAG